MTRGRPLRRAEPVRILAPCLAAVALVLVGASGVWAQSGARETADTPLPAQLVAARQTVLSVEIAGRIDRLPVRLGDRFAEGDVLIGIDCAIHDARVDEARAASHAADTASAVHRRLRDLNSASTLETELAVAEAAQARAKLQSARTVAAKCAVAAPFAGRVVKRLARPHEYVKAGQPVLDILDDRALEAEFILPSHWVDRVAIGQRVRLTVDETGRTHPATITRLGARVDPVSHSLDAVATVEGETGGLLAGMTGRIRLGAE
ncbi:efflux RND transporter periplasmic adaptor subunit [Roseospira navarrensis]|uniref:Efflux RND transporter periplasmic adaptor subunit n=1 Tax=Roseospira navarrensis TaxID=140058 RepID=A0A7X2D2E6_9PROT|nr:efflux RND transporter periplasmic adaptor subunit [Roseospira navarrensis]MQX35601.1 efflux RND transporter periplasmic adaptor subunit [Roseospira navarrensis]